jgi:ankyrin repeat protein
MLYVIIMTITVTNNLGLDASSMFQSLKSTLGFTDDRVNKYTEQLAQAIQFLATAIKYGDLQACERILMRYEIINSKNAKGRTPLMHAAQMGRTKICKLLLFYQASSLEVDATGKDACTYAKDAGYNDLAKLIKNPDFPTNGRPFVAKHHTDMLDFMRIPGLSVLDRFSPGHLASENLFQAALHLDAECLATLLNLDILDVNADDEYTPLHCLFITDIKPGDLQKRKECLEILLKHKDILHYKVTGRGHATILHLACLDDDVESAQLILDHDPSMLRKVNRNGHTVMHWAAAFWSLECLKLFYSLDKSLINQVDRSGENPLDQALRSSIPYRDTHEVFIDTKCWCWRGYDRCVERKSIESVLFILQNGGELTGSSIGHCIFTVSNLGSSFSDWARLSSTDKEQTEVLCLLLDRFGNSFISIDRDIRRIQPGMREDGSKRRPYKRNPFHVAILDNDVELLYILISNALVGPYQEVKVKDARARLKCALLALRRCLRFAKRTLPLGREGDCSYELAMILVQPPLLEDIVTIFLHELRIGGTFKSVFLSHAKSLVLDYIAMKVPIFLKRFADDCKALRTNGKYAPISNSMQELLDRVQNDNDFVRSLIDTTITRQMRLAKPYANTAVQSLPV